MIDKFIDKYEGKTKGYPNDSFYKGQCLSIVKLYIKECFGINPPPSGSNSAYGYWSNFPNPLDTVFEKVKNTTKAIITKGCIPVWKPTTGNKWGHIEICVKDGTLKTFQSFGQNWGGKHSHITRHSYKNVVGWLKPKVYNQSEGTPVDNITKFLKEKGKYNEGDVREMYGAWLDKEKLDKTITKLNKEIKDLKKLQKSFETRLSELETKVKENEANEVNWQKDIKTAKQSLANKIKKMEIIDNERKQWKSRYETKCKELNEESYKAQKWTVLIRELLDRIFKKEMDVKK